MLLLVYTAPSGIEESQLFLLGSMSQLVLEDHASFLSTGIGFMIPTSPAIRSPNAIYAVAGLP